MIRRIWSKGGGILVLTFLHNSTSYAASTREAILIDFVGIENVTNVRKGSYYGGVKNWDRNVLANMGKFYMMKIITEGLEQHLTPILKMT